MSGHLHIALGSTNVYALEDRAGVLLIDAGPDYPGAWEHLLAALAESGVGAGDVRTVVLTHGHRDHAGLAARWQQAGASIIAGRRDADLLALDAEARAAMREAVYSVLREFSIDAIGAVPGAAADQDSEGSLETDGESGLAGQQDDRPHRSSRVTPRYRGALGQVRSDHGSWPGPLRMTPVRADRLLDHGDVVSIGTWRIEALAVPGHTPGSMLLRRNGDQVVYTGDHILPRMVASVGIQVEGGVRVPAMPAFVRSLHLAAALGGIPGFPGHGSPVADVAAAARWSLRYIDRRAARVRRLLAEGSTSAWGVARALYPHMQPDHVTTVLAEVIGLLDLLQEDADTGRP